MVSVSLKGACRFCGESALHTRAAVTLRSESDGLARLLQRADGVPTGVRRMRESW